MDWNRIGDVTEIKMDVEANINVKVGLAVSAQTYPKDPAFLAHATFSRVDVTGGVDRQQVARMIGVDRLRADEKFAKLDFNCGRIDAVAGNFLREAANSLLDKIPVLRNKIPVPISRELSATN